MDIKKVLIIDDEIDICLLVSSILRKEGYETTVANTLAEGEQKFVEFNPQVVFLDLNLPDGVGFSIIPKLKKLNAEIRINIVSAYDGITERSEAKKHGIQHFISKPLNRDAVIQAIKPT
jgi:two-component system, OmpR family, response regulator